MKPECGGCDSRVPRRAAAAHRMESKYKRQSELSELGERQERASEGLSSLDYHVNMRASAIRMHQDKREPDGNLSSLHQSARPPCSCIGISGGVLSRATAGCEGMMLEAPWSLKRLAGTDFKANQVDDHALDLRDTAQGHAQGGHAGHCFAHVYSSRVMRDNVGLRWLLPPKAWGCLNVFAHGTHAHTHSNLQEKSGA